MIVRIDAPRRSRKKLHLGVGTDTGKIIATTLTSHYVNDGPQVGPLLIRSIVRWRRLPATVRSARDDLYDEAAARHSAAPVIAPPRLNAVPSCTAETVPMQRDRHLPFIAKHGRMNWQKISGYAYRALVEAYTSR